MAVEAGGVVEGARQAATEISGKILEATPTWVMEFLTEHPWIWDKAVPIIAASYLLWNLYVLSVYRRANRFPVKVEDISRRLRHARKVGYIAGSDEGIQTGFLVDPVEGTYTPTFDVSKKAIRELLY